MHSCPYCSQAIEPPPKRSRGCPHCRKPIVIRRGQLLTPEAALAFDAGVEQSRSNRRAIAKQERFREGRKIAIAQLRQARDSEVCSGLNLLLSAHDCDVCKEASKRFFPIETCTAEMLPPYKDCELEDGCSASFVIELSPQYQTWLDDAQRSKSVDRSKKGYVRSVPYLILAGLIFWLLFSFLVPK